MVGDVISPAKAVAIGLLTSVLCAPALALGPKEPFVAPNPLGLDAGSAQGEGAKDDIPEQGLSGVRVGRLAGAVIDGQWVRKGRTVRGARLIEVRRNSVTLRHRDGRREVLFMFPAKSQSTDTSVPVQKEVVKP